MPSILEIPRLGGFLIWLWKRYYKKNKKATLIEERDITNWRTWAVGAITIGILIFISVILVLKFE